MIKEIVIPSSLGKRIRNLPKPVRKKFYWCLGMLIKDENYPSLRHKKIQGTDAYWEFTITMNYRCVYRKDSDRAFLAEVGKHEDVL